jgi:hypothetical protein
MHDHIPPDEIGPDGLAGVEREELLEVVRIGYYALPVALIHLVLIYGLVSAFTGWRLPSSPLNGLFAGWIWVNGATVAAGAWLWRKGSLKTVSGRKLRGRRARFAIIAYFVVSIGTFVAPTLARLADELRALLAY